MKIRVLMIDDHTLFLAGLEDILAREEDIEVVGVAGSCREGVSLAMEKRPDVIVLDLAMPGTSGVEAANPVDVVLDAHFDNARMERIYPNAKKVSSHAR